MPVCETLRSGSLFPDTEVRLAAMILTEAGLMEIETAPSENLSHEHDSVNCDQFSLDQHERLRK